MTHPQLEKVARAIWRAGFHPNEDERLVEQMWNECPNEHRVVRARARAAIQALLEPDTDEPAYLAGEYSRRNIEAYLLPLVEGEG